MKCKKYNKFSVIYKNIADMIGNINNKIGDSGSTERYIGKFYVCFENVSASVCLLAALVFLFIAIFGAWRYFFLMGLCLSVAIMIYEEPPRETPKKKTSRRPLRSS